MYNLFSGEQVKKLRGHYGRVTSCICNATDIECYTSSSDGTVLIWSPKLPEVSLILAVYLTHICPLEAASKGGCVFTNCCLQ